MENSSSNSVEALALKLMYSIAAKHTTRDANHITELELYPLKEKFLTQHMQGTCKSHLKRVFFSLGMLKSHGKKIIIKDQMIDQFNKSFTLETPFQLVTNVRGKPSIKTIELTINSNKLDVDKFDLLTEDDKREICSMQEECKQCSNTLEEDEPKQQERKAKHIFCGKKP